MCAASVVLGLIVVRLYTCSHPRSRRERAIREKCRVEENDSGPALLTISDHVSHWGTGVRREVAIVRQWGAQLKVLLTKLNPARFSVPPAPFSVSPLICPPTRRRSSRLWHGLSPRSRGTQSITKFFSFDEKRGIWYRPAETWKGVIVERFLGGFLTLCLWIHGGAFLVGLSYDTRCASPNRREKTTLLSISVPSRRTCSYSTHYSEASREQGWRGRSSHTFSTGRSAHTF